jgi:hypothetical protein
MSSSETKKTPKPNPQSYFEQRMTELGITAEFNKIDLWRYNGDSGKNELFTFPVFLEHPKGIEIIPYTLDRHRIRIEKDGSKQKRDWSMVRYQVPITKTDGDIIKYLMPKGKGSFPLIPPNILQAYDKKELIPELYLTEGYFKAWKGHMHGLPIIGLPSITHLKDKEKGTLHPDILQIIQSCGVKRAIWLTDGDCLDITGKEITDRKDLYTRPANFFSSISTFKQLLDDHDCDKYFMHVDSENALSKKNFMAPVDQQITRDKVKGLDDLLITFPDQVSDIITDLRSVSRPGEWFQKFNITSGLGKVRDYFRLDNVTRFYLFHVEKRKDLKDKEFMFHGTCYKYSEESNACEVRIPGESRLYFRVGDDYYKHVKIPNKHGQKEGTFKGRRKGTIIDDHGKEFTKHIPKYEAFCNVPSNVNFQPIIDNCFNLYNPLDYMPDEESCTELDCPTIISFIKHIFGERMASFRHPVTHEKHEYPNYELGLDYLQILYQQPPEKLPILCLVSKENNTGKSTFGNLLKLIFGSNVAIVGNQDLAGDFNAHWATKLVVICDETKIDKIHVVEKVKSLSTAHKVTMNAKGKDHIEIDCYIKFIFITNNEENFMWMSDDDIRYWVNKVPVIRQENPRILENFVEEIPSFLSFLNNRKLLSEKLNRMWFHPGLLKTDALKKVIQFSRPTVEKEIRQRLRDMFFDFGITEVMMTRHALHKEFFNNKYEANYIEKVLKEDMRIDQYHDLDPVQKDVFGNPVKEYKTKRHSYPKWEEVFKDGMKRTERVEVEGNGRPYVFRREMFMTPEEIEKIKVDPETSYQNNLFNNNGPAPAAGEKVQPVDELPF